MVLKQKELPIGWININNLGNKGKVYNGLSGKKKEDFGYGKPYVTYVNIFKNSKVDINEVDFVSIKKGEKQNIIEYGDIIFTTSSETIKEVGMSSVFLDKNVTLFLNSFCFIYRISKNNWLDPTFSQYLFRSDKLRFDISLLGQGSTRYNLSKTRLLSELEFQIPESLIEQKKIASVLSKIDESIFKTQVLIDKYTRIKIGLTQELLTLGLSLDNSNLVETGLKKIRVTKDFTISTLQKITKVRQGYQIPISKRKKEEGQNRYVYITVQYLNNPKKYLEYIENPPINVICKKDEILFTRTGNTGQIVSGVEGVYHNNFFKVSFDKEVITQKYLLYFLKWKPVQDLIKELAGTTTIPDMKHKSFYSIPIFFPSDLKEQKEITNIIDSTVNKLNSLKQDYSKLNLVKTGLMQDLLSGKVRV